MKKRFVFLILIIIALFIALFLKKCATGRIVPVKPEMTPAPQAAVLPGESLKKTLKESIAPGVKDYDMLVVRVDAFGNTKWIKTFGTKEYDWADFIVQCDDGGFLALGRTYYQDGEDDYYIVKIDSAGNSLWTKNFAGKNGQAGDAVAQAADNGYIITGKSSSGSSDEKEVFIAKTDKEGNYEWVHNFGREYYEWGYTSIISEDGSYFIIGQDETPDIVTDLYLRKRENDGNYAWAKSYGGRDYDWGYGIARAAGGNVIAGLTYSYGNGNDDAYLVKTDMEGVKLWEKTYGGPGYDEAFSICGDGRTGFALSGATTSWGMGGHDVYLVKTDHDGNNMWSNTYGGAGNDAGYSINRTSDGGYIIAGVSNSVWGDKR